MFRSATTTATSRPVAGVTIPDSKLAREVTELVKDTESPLLFHHSSRVYYWDALSGKRRGLHIDPELLYAGAMFHDMGLTPQYASADKRFEVDGAHVACDFRRSHGNCDPGSNFRQTRSHRAAFARGVPAAQGGRVHGHHQQRPKGEEGDQPGFAVEKSAADDAGLGYSFVPLAGPQITEADVRALQEAVSAAPGPVFAKLWKRHAR